MSAGRYEIRDEQELAEQKSTVLRGRRRRQDVSSVVVQAARQCLGCTSLMQESVVEMKVGSKFESSRITRGRL